MFRNLALSSALVVSCALSTGVCAQSLLGSTVEFGAYYPTPSSPISHKVVATVNDGIEFTQIGSLNLPGWWVGNADVDISADRIHFDYASSGTSSNGAFNGYVFNFQGLGGQAITGVTLDGATNLPIGSVSLQFDSDSVLISIPNTPFSPDSVLAVSIQLAPVPEPGAVSMLLAGGLLLAVSVRRRAENSSTPSTPSLR